MSGFALRRSPCRTAMPCDARGAFSRRWSRTMRRRIAADADSRRRAAESGLISCRARSSVIEFDGARSHASRYVDEYIAIRRRIRQSIVWIAYQCARLRGAMRTTGRSVASSGQPRPMSSQRSPRNRRDGEIWLPGRGTHERYMTDAGSASFPEDGSSRVTAAKGRCAMVLPDGEGGGSAYFD